MLLQVASEQGVDLADAICVGDGANDLEMLSAVGESGGLGVAFDAKPRVQEEAPNRLTASVAGSGGHTSKADEGWGLLGLLFCLGYGEEEIRKLVEIRGQVE